MKKTAIGQFIAVIIVLTLCCNPDKESVISGVILHLNGSEMTVNEQTVQVSSDGNFTYSEALDKPAYFTLNFGKVIHLYLLPGDRVTVEIDAESSLSSIETSGGQQSINQYLLLQSQDALELNEKFNRDFSKIVRLGEREFVEMSKSLWAPFQERMEALIREQKIKDEYFIKTQRASFQYSYANILMLYPVWHRKAGGATDYSPSETYYDFVDDLDLNDPELLEEEEYKTFLNTYLDFKTDERLAESTEFENRNYKRFRAQMKTALELFNQHDVRSEMLFPFMKYLLGNYSHRGIDDLILTFMQNCSNPEYLEEIEQLLRGDKAIRDSCKVQVYKTIDDVPLEVFIYLPSELKEGDKRPAVAFFHGGGWECGKPEWGQMQCEHFSSLGMVAFSFEYRLSTQHDTTPIESLKDTKSAIRWIRENAEEWGVDPGKIIGSGYSAGGHLVMCTAMVEGYEEPYEDSALSPAVNAMMLWVTPAVVYPGWFTDILRGRAELKEFNPIELVKPGLPPAIFFQGTADDTVPYHSVEAYVRAARALGNRCDFEVYEGQTHLNWGENAKDVLKKMDAFLMSLGYLKENQN